MCSDQRSKEVKHVTAELMANGYPKRFVIDVGKPKRPSQQLSTAAPDAARGFCILPYIKGTTESIKQILRACTKTRNGETKRPKQAKQNHRNGWNEQRDQNETSPSQTTETTETKAPKQNYRNEQNNQNEMAEMPKAR